MRRKRRLTPPNGHIAHLTYFEIARILGTSVQNVSQTHDRAIRKLRRRLGGVLEQAARERSTEVA